MARATTPWSGTARQSDDHGMHRRQHSDLPGLALHRARNGHMVLPRRRCAWRYRPCHALTTAGAPSAGSLARRGRNQICMHNRREWECGGIRDCPWGAACVRLKGQTVRERARILVVEDEMLFAETLVGLLEDGGFSAAGPSRHRCRGNGHHGNRSGRCGNPRRPADPRTELPSGVCTEGPRHPVHICDGLPAPRSSSRLAIAPLVEKPFLSPGIAPYAAGGVAGLMTASMGIAAARRRSLDRCLRIRR